MLEEANRANDLAALDNTGFSALLVCTSTKVARITNDLLGLDGLGATTNADEFAIRIGYDLVDRLVEHVGTAVDCRKAGKGLREFAKTVERVNVG